MEPTLKDVAKKAQVSVSLVSKVLNQRDVRVSPEKRELILKIAREMGYKPREEARTVEVKRKKLIALIQPSFEFEFLTKLTGVIRNHVRKNGYDLIIFDTDESVEEEKRCLDLCVECGASGIILNSCDNHANTERINLLKSISVPIVFVDRYIYDYDGDYVATNNYDGAYRLTNALIKKGHKDILFLFHGKAMFTSVLHERFAGYQLAMSEHGLVSIKEYVYSGRSIKYQSVFQMISGAPMFSAIVLSTSWDFTSLLDLLKHMHYDSKNKIDVAAFDSFSVPYDAVVNKQLFERINPNIIIAKQNEKQLGEKAVDLLIKRIQKRGRAPAEAAHIQIPTSIIEIK